VTRDDIVDPRVVPRWVEAGVSGVPRAAEWDYVTIADVGELAGSITGEVAFEVLPGGEVTHATDVPRAAVELFAARLSAQLPPPFEGVAIRQGARRWAVAGKRASIERIELPAGLEANEITVVRDPEGSLSVLVDGEEPGETDGALAGAVATLDELGALRHRSFVVRAVSASGGWKLTVDPL